MNVDANPGAVTRHMQENLCPCQKQKITVISGFRTKITVVAKYHAKITMHCRGFWLPYKNCSEGLGAFCFLDVIGHSSGTFYCVRYSATTVMYGILHISYFIVLLPRACGVAMPVRSQNTKITRDLELKYQV